MSLAVCTAGSDGTVRLFWQIKKSKQTDEQTNNAAQRHVSAPTIHLHAYPCNRDREREIYFGVERRHRIRLHAEVRVVVGGRSTPELVHVPPTARSRRKENKPEKKDNNVGMVYLTCFLPLFFFFF